MPIKLILTGGHVHDSIPTLELLEGVTSEYVLADRGYESQEIVQFIEERNSKAVIPQRRNKKQCRIYDRQMYKKRHKIECFF